MENNMKRSKRVASKQGAYPYHHVESALDEFIAGKRKAKLTYAHSRLRGVLYAYAAMEAGGKPSDADVADAWEDFTHALRGYGDPILEGAVLLIQGPLSRRERREFRACMQRAVDLADSELSSSTHQRYVPSDRKPPVVDDFEGVDDAHHKLPRGSRIYRAYVMDEAAESGFDLEDVEELLAFSFEDELLFEDIDDGSDPHPHLRLLPGGEA